MNKIQLGDRVKDPITGITGIAIARTTWLHGCDRITIQPEGFNKEKKPYENITIDEPQLKIVKPKKVKRGSSKTGGPMSSPEQKPNILR